MERLYGGDGFRITFLDDDQGANYFETQRGNLIYSDISGFTTNISPNTSSTSGDRVNWDMPYLINENLSELFVGTSKISLMQSAPYDSYSSISGDLTQVGLGTALGSDRYHTITEMDQPSNNEDILYVGTSDGLVLER